MTRRQLLVSSGVVAILAVCGLVGYVYARTRLASGVAALKISDYSTAMTMFTPLASLGHSKAQYLLGEMNAYGWGTAKDDAAAIRWFKRASMWSAPGVQPEAPAEFFVGQNYDKGVGVDRDPVEAEKWYRRSAEGGYGLAKERLRSSENPVASDENPSASKQP